MAQKFGSTIIVLASLAWLTTACAPATPIPKSDPLIAQAIDAFESGCMDTAPKFENVEEIWRGQNVPKIQENGTGGPFDKFGMITFNGICGVGIKGEARDTLKAELINLMRRRNVEILEESGARPGLTYAAKISFRDKDMVVGVSGRSFPTFGFWSVLVLGPESP